MAKEERKAAKQATDTPHEVSCSLTWILCHPQRYTVGPGFSRTHIFPHRVTSRLRPYHRGSCHSPSWPLSCLQVHREAVIQTLIHLAPDSGSLHSLRLWIEMDRCPPNGPQAGTGGAALKTCPEPAGCQLEKEGSMSLSTRRSWTQEVSSLQVMTPHPRGRKRETFV